MDDKEIGELWWQIHNEKPLNYWWAIKCRNLICKLVEERAWKNAVTYYRDSPDDDAVKSCIVSALRDFGIAPEEWERG